MISSTILYYTRTYYTILQYTLLSTMGSTPRAPEGHQNLAGALLHAFVNYTVT